MSYSSPEVVMNQPHDHSSDVWSLGVLLYTLFERKLPFRGLDKDATISAILGGPIPTLDEPVANELL
jgi:serine/threonine protein kinase